MQQLDDIEERLRGPSTSRISVEIPVRSSIRPTQRSLVASSPLKKASLDTFKSSPLAGTSQTSISRIAVVIPVKSGTRAPGGSSAGASPLEKFTLDPVRSSMSFGGFQAVSAEDEYGKSVQDNSTEPNFQLTPQPHPVTQTQIPKRDRALPTTAKYLSSHSFHIPIHHPKPRSDRTQAKSFTSNSHPPKPSSASIESTKARVESTPAQQSEMVPENATAEKKSGRPQRLRTPSAKMMAITADCLSSVEKVKTRAILQESTTDDDYSPVIKRGRGQARKQENVELPGEPQGWQQHRWKGNQNSTIATATAKQYALIEAQGDLQLLSIDPAQGISRTGVDDLRSSEFEKVTARRVRPDEMEGYNPFAPKTSEAQKLTTGFSPAVSPCDDCDSSPEGSLLEYESASYLLTMPDGSISQFGGTPDANSEQTFAPMPTKQSESDFGSSNSSSGASNSQWGPRFVATKRAPTAQNMLAQRQADPQLIVGPSQREQEIDLQKRQVSVAGYFTMQGSTLAESQIGRENGGISGAPGDGMGGGMAVTPAQQATQLGAAQRAQEAQPQMNPALPHLPKIDIPIPEPYAIRLADVDDFLWNFADVAGFANPSRDVDKSEDEILKILTKWNSIYTIYSRPDHRDSAAIGSEVGLQLSIRAVCTGQIILLSPLCNYFTRLVNKAEREIQNLSKEDMKDYEENGPMSWYYMQMSQKAFAKEVMASVIEIGRKETLKLQQQAAAVDSTLANSGGSGGEENVAERGGKETEKKGASEEATPDALAASDASIQRQESNVE